MSESLAQKIAVLPPERRREILAVSDDELRALLEDWSFWGRPEQQEPEGQYLIWLIKTGRAWGKTRSASEYVNKRVEQGQARRIALVGRTVADCRDTMVEGSSGLLAVAKRGMEPSYVPSKRRITWPNGAIGTTYSAEEPDQLRGPEHDTAWGDEPAAWKHLPGVSGATAWDNLLFGMRLGDPRIVLTTTPKRIPWMTQVLARVGIDTVLTVGSLLDNAGNLPESYVREMLSRYENTALGRQELHGELTDDVEGALWRLAWIEARRWLEPDDPPTGRKVVGVDPSVGDGTGDECGIVVVGIDQRLAGAQRGVFVCEDASVRGTPDAWGRVVVQVARRHGAEVVVESNQGYELCRSVLRTIDPGLPVKLVPATQDKATRAAPVATLYEQGRASHVGYLGALEGELTGWVPGVDKWSPNRLDALVHAVRALLPGIVSNPARLSKVSQQRWK